MRKPYMLQRTVTVKEVTVALVNKDTNKVVFDTFKVPKQCMTEKDILSEVKSQLSENFAIAYLKEINEVTSMYKMLEEDFIKYGTKIFEKKGD